MQVQLSRDSVAAGDDASSHDEVVDIDGRRPLGLVVAEILNSGYLPSIHGGAATWLVRSGRRGPALGVVAQQWTTPELFQEGSAAMSAVGSALYFEYRAQEDPRMVADTWRLPGGDRS